MQLAENWPRGDNRVREMDQLGGNAESVSRMRKYRAVATTAATALSRRCLLARREVGYRRAKGPFERPTRDNAYRFFLAVFFLAVFFLATFFFAGAFLAAFFLAVFFLATFFLAGAFLAVFFLATFFFAGAFLATFFLAVFFLAGAFFTAFLATFFLVAFLAAFLGAAFFVATTRPPLNKVPASSLSMASSCLEPTSPTRHLHQCHLLVSEVLTSHFIPNEANENTCDILPPLVAS